jgi:hypothetical protein
MFKSIIGSVILLLINAKIGNAQVPKKIVVEHFTNTNCSTCASRNPGFYTNLNSQESVLHLAIHPSSPYSNCLLYQQNATANDARTNYYGVYGATPRFIINGEVLSGGLSPSNSSIFAPFQSLTSPASIRIVQEKFAQDSIRATIIIKTVASHSLPGLSLFTALAEDTVFYTGGNGEQMHFDVFRKSLSTVTGTPLTLPAQVGDSLVFNYSSVANSTWDFSRIYTLAILQETDAKSVVQSEAANPVSNILVTGINTMNADFGVNLFPNPTDALVRVELNQLSNAKLSVYSSDGKLVLQKFTSQSETFLDLSNLPAASYVLTIDSEKGRCSKRLIKK